MKLTDNQLTTLRTDGYIVIDCPFPSALTDACIDAVNRTLSDPANAETDTKRNHYRLTPQLPGSFWCALDHSLPFLQIELHPEIVELARQLEDTHDIYFRNGGINELAPGRSFAWHRDSEWDYIEYMHYFGGASVENGCLRAVPGTQEGPIEPWMDRVKSLRADQGFKGDFAPDGPPDVSLLEEVPIEVSPGQLVIRSSRFLHATHRNESDEGRYMHHWLFRHPDADNHRMTFRDYLTPDLIDTLTEEQHEVLWLDREFEIHERYHAERKRELGKVSWGIP